MALYKYKLLIILSATDPTSQCPSPSSPALFLSTLLSAQTSVVLSTVSLRGGPHAQPPSTTRNIYAHSTHLLIIGSSHTSWYHYFVPMF